MDGEPIMGEMDAALLNPLQLAYMGDAVWEGMVRRTLILRRMNVHHMHTECVRRVNAQAQAQAFRLIRPLLTETEGAIAQRGRNSHPRHPSPRHQDPADYAEATGFEALIGYLYLTGQASRLETLGNIILEGEGQNG